MTNKSITKGNIGGDIDRVVIRIDIPVLPAERIVELRAAIRSVLKDYPNALLDISLLPPLTR